MPHVRPLITKVFGRVITETPYDTGWIDAIKHVIPTSRRKFVGGQTWSFDPNYYTCVRVIVEYYFGSAYIDATGGVAEPQTTEWIERWKAYTETEGRRKQQEQQRQQYSAPRQPAKVSSAFDTLFVTANAPKEVIVAAWRALIAIYHTDKGGTIEQAQRINGAYAELKKIGKV